MGNWYALKTFRRSLSTPRTLTVRNLASALLHHLRLSRQTYVFWEWLTIEPTFRISLGTLLLRVVAKFPWGCYPFKDPGPCLFSVVTVYIVSKIILHAYKRYPRIFGMHIVNDGMENQQNPERPLESLLIFWIDTFISFVKLKKAKLYL